MNARTLYVLRGAVALVASSAFVAIWGGWVGLGHLAGFGPVNLLPGIGDGLTVNLAITLPLGIEAYAAIALYVAVSGTVRGAGRVFAWCSAVGALALGAFGQSAYHVLSAEQQAAGAVPTPIVVFVSVLPVVVLGLASVLLHLAEAAHRRVVSAVEAPVSPMGERPDLGAVSDRAKPVQPAGGTGGTRVPDTDAQAARAADGKGYTLAGTPGAPGGADGPATAVQDRAAPVPGDGTDAETGGDVAAHPWIADEDPDAAAFYAAVQTTVQPPGGTLGTAVQGERHDTGTPLHAAAAEPIDGDRERGRELIRAAVRAGRHFTMQGLIDAHGMSERWWRYRLGEVRDEMAHDRTGAEV